MESNTQSEPSRDAVLRCLGCRHLKEIGRSYYPKRADIGLQIIRGCELVARVPVEYWPIRPFYGCVGCKYQPIGDTDGE
jgi:hypothetical protein